MKLKWNAVPAEAFEPTASNTGPNSPLTAGVSAIAPEMILGSASLIA